MKTSKKIIIPFFSTIVGLSLAAGVGGAFAWYQYNSRVSASFIGTSVADTGTLQIGYKDSSDVMHWGRDFDLGDADLIPVTFGELGADDALPANAYAYPESGCGEGYTGWQAAVANEDYVQYEVYIRALQADKGSAADTANQIKGGYKRVERKVFISDHILQVGDGSGDSVADEALRIHINIDGGANDGENHLISKEAVSNLALSGKMDLDGSGATDVYHETAFEPLPSGKTEGEDMIYGVDGDTQTTEGLEGTDAIEQQRDSTTGLMPTSGELFSTSETEDIKLTITIWLEGWALLKTEEVAAGSNVWDAQYSTTEDDELKVGLQFDTGKFREDDLA